MAAERFEPMAKGQAERLMPMLEEMLAGAGLTWSDLGGIGVGTGPGNFTGLRIAVAAARGLALGLGVEAIGVSAFEAAAEGRSGPVTVALPAPREQAYVATLPGGDPALVPLTEVPRGAHGPLAPEALAPAVARLATARLGTGAPRPAPLYVRGPDAAPPSDPPPRILA